MVGRDAELLEELSDQDFEPVETDDLVVSTPCLGRCYEISVAVNRNGPSMASASVDTK